LPTADSLYPRAGIYAEFGKIICISVGYLVPDGTALHLRKKSFFGDDERVLLEEFAELLNKHFSKADSRLCAHNGKEFDFPWLSRRMIINNIPLPAILDTAGRKPWEVNHLDTMEMWKFGDYKSYTPLNLLTYILGIPSPKDDIDGSQVYSVYYHLRDLPRIVQYCEKDVEALVKVFLRLKGVGVI
jgi:predicted PolB exonuclease-like 3'-5' exonuclease